MNPWQKKGAKEVTIEEKADKRCITGTFRTFFNPVFLPFQLIYGGKTSQSIPKVAFPDLFSLTHYTPVLLFCNL